MVTKLQTSPGTVVVPETGTNSENLVIRSLSVNKTIKVSNIRIVKVFSFCSEPKEKFEIKNYCTEELSIDEETAEETMKKFESNDFLIPATSEIFEVFEEWEKNGWSTAYRYLQQIRDHPYLDYNFAKEAFTKDDNLMKEYRQEEEVPPIYKEIESDERISLPTVDRPTSAPIDSLIDYDPVNSKPTLDTQSLSNILQYVFGETGRIFFDHQGSFLRKTSPSGGARHPTETYVIVLDENLISPGIYHYSVENHSLDIIREDIGMNLISDTIFGLAGRVPFTPNVVLVMTSVVERSMWRYRESKSYKVLQHDVGHLIETLRLVAKGENVNTVAGHGFEDKKLSELLEINPYDEILLRYAALG